MAGPWEKYRASAAAENGPWTKYTPPQPKEEERGAISPFFRKSDGSYGWAVPQIAVDIGNALTAPGRAWRGEYGLEIDNETGKVSPVTDSMMRDAASLATLVPASGVGGMVSTGPRVALESPRPFRAARQVVARQLSQDGVPLPKVQEAMRSLGPDAMLADLTPGTQAMAQGIATHQGAGQKTLVDALTARQAGANTRIQQGVNETLGAAREPSAIDAEIRAAQKALSPEYEAAFSQASRVDTSGLRLDLESAAVNERGAAQSAARQILDMLKVTGTDELDPNPRTLFATRRAIDGMLNGETDGNVRRVLAGARKQVDDLLAESVPGIKEVDAKFADLAGQREAVERGQQVLDSGRNAPRPEELASEFAAASPGQQIRLSEGARAEIDRIIGTKNSDKVALRQILKGEGSWNRDRLTTVFGKEKADKLLAIFEREARYALTENPALGGARSEVIRAADEALNAQPKGPGVIQNALDFKLGTSAAKAVDKLTGGAMAAAQERRNAIVADILSSGADDPLLQAVLAYQASKLPMLTNVGARVDAQPAVEQKLGKLFQALSLAGKPPPLP